MISDTEQPVSPPAPTVSDEARSVRREFLEAHFPDEEGLREYLRLRSMDVIASAIDAGMYRAQLSRPELAKKLGISLGKLTKMFRSIDQMTLKTFGAIQWACGREVGDITLAPIYPTEPPAPSAMESK
jgi:hypothetical protein